MNRRRSALFLATITALALTGCQGTPTITATAVPEQAAYSSKPPVITRTVSGGTITAKADAGVIDATGLTAQTTSFVTDVGGIDVAFTSPPRDGRVTVSVPHGAGATRTITASADVGAVDVAPS
jgi:hypothetical protein